MTLRCGLVGLPNSGKSTLFNALASGTASVASYPFCTIDPNIGVSVVPDRRLETLHAVYPTAEVVPATLEVVDIAGLVKGASQGEGLGNTFLSHIRSVDAVLHVVRGFVDDDIPHVYGESAPLRDIEIIETELLLADLEVLRRAVDRATKRAKGSDRAAQLEVDELRRWQSCAEQGRIEELVRMAAPATVPAWLPALQLLSIRPVLFLLNVGDHPSPAQPHWERELTKLAESRGARWLRFNGKLEAELSSLAPDERGPFLEELGFKEPGLAAVVREAYTLLGLISFFTAGDREVRAWALPVGSTVVEAAGKIHSDMARGFIRAEVIDYETFVAFGSMAAVREQGKLRIEGRDYIVKDGDLLLIRFNV